MRNNLYFEEIATTYKYYNSLSETFSPLAIRSNLTNYNVFISTILYKIGDKAIQIDMSKGVIQIKSGVSNVNSLPSIIRSDASPESKTFLEENFGEFCQPKNFVPDSKGMKFVRKSTFRIFQVIQNLYKKEKNINTKSNIPPTSKNPNSNTGNLFDTFNKNKNQQNMSTAGSNPSDPFSRVIKEKERSMSFNQNDSFYNNIFKNNFNFYLENINNHVLLEERIFNKDIALPQDNKFFRILEISFQHKKQSDKVYFYDLISNTIFDKSRGLVAEVDFIKILNDQATDSQATNDKTKDAKKEEEAFWLNAPQKLWIPIDNASNFIQNRINQLEVVENLPKNVDAYIELTKNDPNAASQQIYRGILYVNKNTGFKIKESFLKNYFEEFAPVNTQDESLLFYLDYDKTKKQYIVSSIGRGVKINKDIFDINAGTFKDKKNFTGELSPTMARAKALEKRRKEKEEEEAKAKAEAEKKSSTSGELSPTMARAKALEKRRKEKEEKEEEEAKAKAEAEKIKSTYDIRDLKVRQSIFIPIYQSTTSDNHFIVRKEPKDVPYYIKLTKITSAQFSASLFAKDKVEDINTLLKNNPFISAYFEEYTQISEKLGIVTLGQVEGRVIAIPMANNKGKFKDALNSANETDKKEKKDSTSETDKKEKKDSTSETDKKTGDNASDEKIDSESVSNDSNFSLDQKIIKKIEDAFKNKDMQSIKTVSRYSISDSKQDISHKLLMIEKILENFSDDESAFIEIYDHMAKNNSFQVYADKNKRINILTKYDDGVFKDKLNQKHKKMIEKYVSLVDSSREKVNKYKAFKKAFTDNNNKLIAEFFPDRAEKEKYMLAGAQKSDKEFYVLMIDALETLKTKDPVKFKEIVDKNISLLPTEYARVKTGTGDKTAEEIAKDDELIEKLKEGKNEDEKKAIDQLYGFTKGKKTGSELKKIPYDIFGIDSGKIEKAESRGESRGESKGESKGESRGVSRGESRGGSRGESRGGSSSNNKIKIQATGSSSKKVAKRNTPEINNLIDILAEIKVNKIFTNKYINEELIQLKNLLKEKIIDTKKIAEILQMSEKDIKLVATNDIAISSITQDIDKYLKEYNDDPIIDQVLRNKAVGILASNEIVGRTLYEINRDFNKSLKEGKPNLLDNLKKLKKILKIQNVDPILKERDKDYLNKLMTIFPYDSSKLDTAVKTTEYASYQPKDNVEKFIFSEYFELENKLKKRSF